MEKKQLIKILENQTLLSEHKKIVGDIFDTYADEININSFLLVSSICFMCGIIIGKREERLKRKKNGDNKMITH